MVDGRRLAPKPNGVELRACRPTSSRLDERGVASSALRYCVTR